MLAWMYLVYDIFQKLLTEREGLQMTASSTLANTMTTRMYGIYMMTIHEFTSKLNLYQVNAMVMLRTYME